MSSGYTDMRYWPLIYLLKDGAQSRQRLKKKQYLEAESKVTHLRKQRNCLGGIADPDLRGWLSDATGQAGFPDLSCLLIGIHLSSDEWDQ